MKRASELCLRLKQTWGLLLNCPASIEEPIVHSCLILEGALSPCKRPRGTVGRPGSERSMCQRCAFPFRSTLAKSYRRMLG